MNRLSREILDGWSDLQLMSIAMSIARGQKPITRLPPSKHREYSHGADAFVFSEYAMRRVQRLTSRPLTEDDSDGERAISFVNPLKSIRIIQRMYDAEVRADFDPVFDKSLMELAVGIARGFRTLTIFGEMEHVVDLVKNPYPAQQYELAGSDVDGSDWLIVHQIERDRIEWLSGQQLTVDPSEDDQATQTISFKDPQLALAMLGCRLKPAAPSLKAQTA